MSLNEWERKGVYYLQHEDGSSICWDNKKEHVLLWIGKQPEKFDNVTEAIKYYDSRKQG